MIDITREFTKELARRIEQNLEFLQIVLGPRQVGKTTGVLQLEKICSRPIVYSSADSPIPPTYEWIRSEWQKASFIEGNPIFVIDEIQKVKGWSEVVKELHDEKIRKKKKLQVVLLGSASWSIETGLTESLHGRFEINRVKHWSLSEHQEIHKNRMWDVETYLQFGGYPAPSVLIDEVSRWQQYMKDSVLEPALSRDLLSLRIVSKPALFRQTCELVCRYPAQEISLQKLVGQLQDVGNSTTIKGYLEILEAGFIIKSLSKYSPRALSVKSSSPKILPLCPALIHTFENPKKILSDPEWKGRVFEAAIGSRLLQDYRDLFYWRDGDQEIDFVIEHDGETIGIEVKSGRKKKSIGAAGFRKKFPKSRVLVLDYESGSKILRGESLDRYIESAI